MKVLTKVTVAEEVPMNCAKRGISELKEITPVELLLMQS